MSMDWPLVRLGEVVRGEREPVGTLDGNGLPVLGVTNVEGVTRTGVEASDDKSKYIRLRPGRFVYNPYRINVGSIGLSTESQDAICSPAYVVFKPTERIDQQFLWFFLKSARGNQLINFHGNRGTVRSALRFEDLCEIEIPLPPLAAQQRIVARIEELAAHINEARELRRQAAEEAEALESSVAENTFTALLASGVDAVRFEDACNRITVGHVSSMRHAYCDDGVPFLRSQNVRKNRFEKRGLCFISSNFHTANPKSALRPGDVVIVRTGFVGVACVVPDSLTESNCADLVIVRPGNKLDPNYAARFLNCPSGRARASVASVGSAQKHYNVGAMKKTMLPLPPLPEQRRIVTELDALQTEVDALKRLQADTTAELDALLPSVLDRAFRGEL